MLQTHTSYAVPGKAYYRYIHELAYFKRLNNFIYSPVQQLTSLVYCTQQPEAVPLAEGENHSCDFCPKTLPIL